MTIGSCSERISWKFGTLSFRSKLSSSLDKVSSLSSLSTSWGHWQWVDVTNLLNLQPEDDSVSKKSVKPPSMIHGILKLPRFTPRGDRRVYMFNTSPGLIWVPHLHGGPDVHLTRLTSSHWDVRVDDIASQAARRVQQRLVWSPETHEKSTQNDEHLQDFNPDVNGKSHSYPQLMAFIRSKKPATTPKARPFGESSSSKSCHTWSL